MANLFTYNPDASDAPLPRGRHEVEIIAAEARTSRAGNPMLDLTYRAHGPAGDVILKDYLVATPRSKWKIKRFCSVLGLDFDKGEIDPQSLIGRRIAVEVGVEEDGQGRDRNTVSDYAQAFVFEEQHAGTRGGSRRNGAEPRGGRTKDAGRLGTLLPPDAIEDAEDDEIPF